ncbi:hypothetical protein JCM11641_008410 [Rhodosporidiobolus odoratus]
MQNDLELTHMDRLTQTQNTIDDLIRIASSTLYYLSHKSSFKPLNPNFPVTQAIPGAEDPHTFADNQKELVDDFLRKAKQLEFLIEALPDDSTQAAATLKDGGVVAQSEETDDAEFEELEKEMKRVNDEYEGVLGEAEQLHRQLEESLQGVLRGRAP